MGTECAADIVTVMNGYEMRVRHTADALEKTAGALERTAKRHARLGVEQNAKNKADAYRREIEKVRTAEEDPGMAERVADSVAIALRRAQQWSNEEPLQIMLHLSICTFMQTTASEIEERLNLKAGRKVRVGRAAIYPTTNKLSIEEDFLLVSFCDDNQTPVATWVAPAGFSSSESYIYTLARTAGDSPSKAEASAREATSKTRPTAGSKIATPVKGAGY